MAITLTASRPARHDRAVVFACDANYARYAPFAADQIDRLLTGRDFDICLCAMGAEWIFAGLNRDARRTEVAYLRLALTEAFAAAYRRLLYLDSDVFVQGGDLSALIDLDLRGRAIGAVRDNTQWRSPDRCPEQFRLLGLPNARYFNSNLLLIDMEEFNSSELLRRCLDFARDRAGGMIGHDQNVLNCVLQGDWGALHPAWNCQCTRATMLFEAIEGARIVHFIGAKKPWKHTGGALPLKFWRAYRAFFAEHFPDTAPLAPDGLRPDQNPGYLRTLFTRHYQAIGSFGRYLAQFDDGWTVV